MNQLPSRPLRACICLLAALLMILPLTACGGSEPLPIPMPQDGSPPVIPDPPTFWERVGLFMHDHAEVLVWVGLILFLLLISFILDRTGLTQHMGFRIVLGLAVSLSASVLMTVQLFLDHGSVSGILQFAAENWVGGKTGPLWVVLFIAAVYVFPLIAGIIWIREDEPTSHLLLGYPILFVVNAGLVYLFGLFAKFIIENFDMIVGSIPLMLVALLTCGGSTTVVIILSKR